MKNNYNSIQAGNRKTVRAFTGWTEYGQDLYSHQFSGKAHLLASSLKSFGAVGMPKGLQKYLGQRCGDARLHTQLGNTLISIVFAEQKSLLARCSLLL